MGSTWFAAPCTRAMKPMLARSRERERERPLACQDERALLGRDSAQRVPWCGTLAHNSIIPHSSTLFGLRAAQRAWGAFAALKGTHAWLLGSSNVGMRTFSISSLVVCAMRPSRFLLDPHHARAPCCPNRNFRRARAFHEILFKFAETLV
jgi:hypothetical protein